MVIEITETVAMQDVFMIRRFIQSVRPTGARIALDDFGKGYSNFLPVPAKARAAA